MKPVVASLVGVVCLLTVSAGAHAQTLVPNINGAVQAPVVLPGQIMPPRNQQPSPLFSIGGLPVGVWAPVPAYYDTAADRNGAANPLWTGANPWSSPLVSG